MKKNQPTPDTNVVALKRLTKLTNKQSRFVEEYLLDLNATQAANIEMELV